MFERAASVLTDKGIEPNQFEVQFVFYRNYNAPAKSLLQCSSWESTPINLRAFMETIKPEYGWGAEAIELGLWQVNQEVQKGNNPSQVILIGDAPPNSNDDVITKRSYRGQSYWESTKFSAPTFYKDEMQQLIEKNIPIHAFYVHEDAREAFQEIADASGGRCEALDIASSSGAELLTNLVTEEILRSIGGASFVEHYRKSYR